MASSLTHTTATIAATSTTLQLPAGSFAITIKAASANAGTAYFMIDNSPANSTSGTALAAGDAISIDISPALLAKVFRGEEITAEKFFRQISYIGTANDILYIDVVTWV